MYQRPLTSDEIYHHGVLGQKWGVKNGLPYPLKINDVNLHIKQYANTTSETVKQIQNKGSDLVDSANRLGDAYQKAYKNVRLSKEDVNKIYKKLKDDFGSGVDDKEFFNDVVEEYVSDFIDNKASKLIPKEKADTYEKNQTEYWNSVNEYVNKLSDQYKDVKIQELEKPTESRYYRYLNSSQRAEKYVKDRLSEDVLDTRYQAYLYRHFEDYWVYDTDARYSKINEYKKSFSFDEYNNRNHT